MRGSGLSWVGQNVRPAALLGRMVLLAQRRNWRVPHPVSRAVYALFGRSFLSRTPEDPTGSWTEPLIGRADVAAPAAGGLDDVAVVPCPDVAPGDAVTDVRFPAPPNSTGRRLRCLVAIHALDVGGMDEMVAFLARGLPRHGVDTTVLYCRDVAAGHPGPGGRLARALAQEGIPVAKVSAEDTRRWIAAHAPDVISAHGTEPFVLDAAEALGIPFVYTLHNTMSGLFGERDWLEESVRGRRMTGLVAVSERVRREYLDRVPGFPPDRIVTVDNGVAFDRLRQPSRPQARTRLGLRDEFLFLCLARHTPQKNTIGLVRAFLDVAEEWPQAHLLVSGEIHDPLYFAQVRELRDRSRHAGRIHLRSNCPRPNVLLAAADAFVLDSFFEGSSLAAMEALTAGLPAVLSDAGAAREQLGPDGERGYVVPNPLGDTTAVDAGAVRAARYRRHANHVELVAAMNKVMRERADWAGRRERLKDDALARFHPDRCLNSYAHVLVGAANGISVQAALSGRASVRG
jgi:glycosyltransferase involved in cell wall biosynthesis